MRFQVASTVRSAALPRRRFSLADGGPDRLALMAAEIVHQAPAGAGSIRYAEHVRQLGGAGPVPSLLAMKG